MRRTPRVSSLLWLVHLFPALSAGGAWAGDSLVVNPSFEEFVVDASGVVSVEQPSGTFSTLADLVGWDEESGQFTLEQYLGAFPPVTGVPPGAGAFVLYGSIGAQSCLRQTVDLQFAAGMIDAGDARYLLSALMGGYHGGTHPEAQQDFATITLRFLTSAQPLELLREDVLVGPSRPSDVGLPDNFNGRNYAVLLSREGNVPIGTDRVEVVVTLQRDADAPADNFNNANVDKIDLQLVPPGCLGDANADGLIDGRDMSVLLAQFGAKVEPGTGSDFNGDSNVDGRDLSVLLAAFGTSC